MITIASAINRKTVTAVTASNTLSVPLDLLLANSFSFSLPADNAVEMLSALPACMQIAVIITAVSIRITVCQTVEII